VRHVPSDQGSPTVRGRRLAAELRRLRERSGLTGEGVARRLGWSGSKVSRIERHHIGIKQPDLRRLLDLYGVTGTDRRELLALARESAQKGWLEKVTASFPPEQANYLRYEAEALAAWTWEPLVVPGLLQTAEYAEAVMHGWQAMFALPPAETERRVRARLIRQQLLTKDPPLELAVVIDESVLHRKFGDKGVMRRQLDRLIELSHLPNIKVRVLTLGAAHPIGCGGFYGLRFPQVHKVPLHDNVAVEHLLGTYYIEDDEDTYKFWVTFQRLMTDSLDAAGSRSLIERTSQQLWS
jgi:transcriptional regulator with XRE-family HTH domain